MSRPRGSGATTVRIVAPKWPVTTWRVYVGRGLYEPLNRPARLRLERADAGYRLRPVAAALGYAVVNSSSTPHLSVGAQLIESLQLAEGTWAAEVQDGAIVFG